MCAKLGGCKERRGEDVGGTLVSFNGETGVWGGPTEVCGMVCGVGFGNGSLKSNIYVGSQLGANVRLSAKVLTMLSREVN